ncbi:Small basic intrinsic protein 1-2 [Forsythia ovata]|uniref:Small basic intrinsic protein 1-2 n=1 Tax=Forsythia ovata TaxID=205694 RepID=A0ABD1RH07_9LAMI
MGAIKAAVADGVLTFMRVFCASTFGTLTFVVASVLGEAQGLPTHVITTVLVFLLLFIFGIIGVSWASHLQSHCDNTFFVFLIYFLQFDTSYFLSKNKDTKL